MIDKILTVLSSLAPALGKFLDFIVGLFKKPLVVKEQEVIKQNEDGKAHFEHDGRPR